MKSASAAYRRAEPEAGVVCLVVDGDHLSTVDEAADLLVAGGFSVIVLAPGAETDAIGPVLSGQDLNRSGRANASAAYLWLSKYAPDVREVVFIP